MDQTILQVGVGGIFALLILKSVFDFLGRRRSNGGDPRQLAEDIRYLRRLHERMDNSGVPILNVRPLLEQQGQLLQSLASSIASLDKHIQNGNALLGETLKHLRGKA